MITQRGKPATPCQNRERFAPPPNMAVTASNDSVYRLLAVNSRQPSRRQFACIRTCCLSRATVLARTLAVWGWR